ncbi:hypothetical protein [Thermoanaerobacterium butyriciformans]|uniref:Phosphoglyceromutase n=1 Tax=Thermoanaerobacterium butyriciformans TaxID=1702242 RepID=A0ABS4NGB8_9THEO|nr:hypothetical protein [Thermoanaerobacterium butyriciformans]MBP2072720.1 hypothetical protein [Thermoanaerobacterium butyriciformans]
MRRKSVLFLILILLFLNIYSIGYAKTDVRSKKAVIFILNRVTIKDYLENDLKNINKMIDNGTYGLMTVNADGGRSEENVFMTIGTGTRAVGSSFASLNFNSWESIEGNKASTIFQRNTGVSPKEGQILNLDIAQIIRNNSKRNHIIRPGLLGDELMKAGYSIAVFGNEDTDIDYKRYAPLIGMNYSGIVPYGDVSEGVLKKDPLRPYGISTDYNRMYEKYVAVKDNIDLTIFDLGDTARANDYQKNGLDKINAQNRKKALQDADNFIGRILSTDDQNTLYMIVTPLPPSAEMGQNDFLAPVVMYGNGIDSNKLITSDTTKRTGIVTNTDVLPTILSYFDLDVPAFVTGHKLYSSGVDGSLIQLNNLEKQLTYNYTYRSPFLKTYVVLQIVILILSIVVLIFFRKYSVYMKPLLLLIPIMPLSFLLLPIFNYTSVPISILEIASMTLFFALIFYNINSKSSFRYFSIALLTGAILIIDMLTGYNLLKNSFLSYDVIAGARFYGIGNEYMGILIGATLCFNLLSFEVFNKANKKYLIFANVLIYIAVLYFIASPSVGTNVGGSIAAFAAFSVSTMYLFGKRLNLKNISLVAISIVALLLLMFYADSLRPVSQQTHIGQTFNLVKNDGLYPLFQIFIRKISMNLKLFRYSIWSKVLITLIFVLFVLFYKPMGSMKKILNEHRFIYICFFSTIVGSIFALIFNDSGVVAAATMMVYTGPMLIDFIIDENREIESRS